LIYSVYDYDKRRFRYYDGLGAAPATGFFRRARVAPIQGAFAPEAFAVMLPPDAKPIGEGPLPKGFIAEIPNANEPGLASTSNAADAAASGSGSGSSSSSSVPLSVALGLAMFAFFLGLTRGSRRQT